MVADPKNFWPAFNEYTWPEVECGDITTSVAKKVLDEYGIPLAPGSADIGGPLETVDIKHMDAMSVIKTSLFDYAIAERAFYEPTVNEEGEVEFIEIGESEADLDIYYTIQTQIYKEPCRGIMVTGAKPLPVRKPLTWKLIWGTPEGKHISDSRGMGTNCNEKKFRTWANVSYKDPHMDSTFEDGIDNLYEIGADNPWDRIIGYVYYIYHGVQTSNDTSVKFQKQAKILVKVGNDGTSDYGPNVGTLTKRERVDPINVDCWYPTEDAPFADGVQVGAEVLEKFRYERVVGDENFPTDNFLGIAAVYLVGIELEKCGGIPRNNNGENVPLNTDLFVMAADASTKMVRLNEGTQYQVAYDESAEYKDPYIVFADNSREGDNAKYGTDATFHLIQGGALSQLNYTATDNKGTVISLGGNKGFIVKEIYAALEIDTPSFEIIDPTAKAAEIAEELEVWVSPIVLEEPPPPIAFNGTIIDQAEAEFDHDPTTEQDLTETQFEEALDLMDGSGLSLTFSYINEQEAIDLSADLLQYMNNPEGDLETTYICGPDSKPKLGETTPNGIVNNIRYSYSDGGSYTISVNAGPKILGNFAELSQGVSFTQQQDASGMGGTIIQDEGNHVVFKVRIDGLGDTYAINCCNSILRVGDKVQCTIHNNPVGER